MESNNTKKCSFCDMEIPNNALRCDYCGSVLDVKIDNDNYLSNGEKQQIPSLPEEENKSYQQDDGNYYSQYDGRNFQQSYNSSYQQYNYQPQGNGSSTPLSNGLKVFLIILFTVIPGLGQLAGIITAIVFMNADDDADRRSFGVALLIASIVMFVLSCIGCFVIGIAFSVNNSFDFNG